ncbi:sensor histidine kinase [Clostridium brassicae]|uniref:histidine kinase n=1 Tax=Clostridium brassicae TaxID=2999072 RepID=A0ABT4DEB3_9CLOT|nr:HAMP domain-containing sensor histidine kinase [Clostridium brassicae]MCY6960642.1 HAMP domain-containing sensor histidine kinase [Clostridium brassicae]
MLRGIKIRIVKSYLCIALLIVAIIEVILCILIKNYYYKNIENSLQKQVNISANIFNKYSYDGNFKSNTNEFIYTFSQMSPAQVQIIDKKLEVIQDSIGIEQGKKIDYLDVTKALNGERYTLIGKCGYSNEKIMSVSAPLKNANVIQGVVRSVASLEEIDKIITKIRLMLILIGIVIICVFMVLSIVVSNTITEPVKQLTNTAQKMAGGQLKIKAEKVYNDEIGELADTLNYMSEEILKTDKLKNEFISKMSHELRTPLTSIKGWTVTLKTGDLQGNEELVWGLDVIEKEADRLTNMVEELLDFSKIIDKRVELNFRKIYLEDFLNMVLRQMYPRAKGLGILLELNISENAYKEVEIDINRLKQVFINILDNALKFTPKGGNVLIEAMKEDDRVRFSIEDNGIGIPKEHLNKVTEKFYKVDAKDCGNGIGLSVVNELVQLHGGNLEIQSEYGKGTKVIIELPDDGDLH